MSLYLAATLQLNHLQNWNLQQGTWMQWVPQPTCGLPSLRLHPAAARVPALRMDSWPVWLVDISDGNEASRLKVSLTHCAAIWLCICHGNVLLTDWSACHLQAQNQLQEWKKTFAIIQQHMGTFLNKLPPYVWLTVLSQLTSRVCHSNMDVATVNNKILLRAALAYPQQVISTQVAS